MIDRASQQMAEGRLISCERISGVNDNMSQSHYHRHYELYFLEQGERFHMMNGEIYETGPNDFMLFAPYVMHHSYGARDVPFQRIVLYFDPAAILSDELEIFLQGASGLYHPDGKVSSEIHSLLDQIIREQDRDLPYRAEAMEALLLQLLVTISRSSGKEEKPEIQNRISKVIEYLEDHYAEDLSLDDLAEEFYTGKYYLCHEFKKYTNKTIVSYLNSLRILHAQQLILETDLRLSEIARQTGFSSPTHFNRVFRSITGQTPSQFRRG